MSKSTALKAVSQFLSLLLCLVLTQAAVAQPEELGGSIIYESGTYENSTITGPQIGHGNYTVHSINPTYYYMFLMPGDSETFNVSFRNEGNETLDISPKIVASPYTYYNVNESWITIFPANAKVISGIEQDFAIEVSVPEDAESGDYQAQIAFTDDIYNDEYTDPVYIQEYPEEYADPQYVNVMHLTVSVPVRPKLKLQTGYISDTLEPGKEYVYMIKIKNVAGKDVTIDPEVVNYGMYDYSFDEPAFSNDIIQLSAPSIIKADELANMTIRIPVPENATGSYNAFIEMNPDGKKSDVSVQQISLSFMVNKQPSVPYAKTFNTTTADPITIEVSTGNYDPDTSVRVSPKKEEPYFEVGLKCGSSPVNLTLVKDTERGTVYADGYNFPIWAMEEGSGYESNSRQYVETYRVPGAIAAWELTILPKNAYSFDYSITVGNSE